jgi:hypothetical protein
VQIRKGQIKALQEDAEYVYKMRLVRFLQDQFPDAAECNQATLIVGVGEQIGKARTYGFLTERQIATYVMSAWLLGDDFDREFLAVQQMLGLNLTPAEKSTWLERFTKDIFDQLRRSA